MTREASTLLIVHDAQRVFASVGIQDPFALPDVVCSAHSHRSSLLAWVAAPTTLTSSAPR